MSPQPLSRKTASEFFQSLYATDVLTLPEFDDTTAKIVAKIGGNRLEGDQALQNLMINFVVANTDDAEKFKERWTWLAGIKREAIAELAKEFPRTNIEALIAAAREAGYEVELLDQ